MNIFVIEHSEDAPLGLLGDLIGSRGWRTTIWRPASDRVAPDVLPARDSGFDALVILGGAMDADDDAGNPHYPSLFHLIDAFYQAKKPILGLCLGGQLLARHFGGQIRRMDQWERGVTPVTLLPAAQIDPLLEGLAPDQYFMEWHRDRFDLPDHATPLISGQSCPWQACRIGTSVYALQGHPEATPEIVRQWAASEQADCVSPQNAAMEPHWEQNRAFAEILLGRWLNLVAACAVNTTDAAIG